MSPQFLLLRAADAGRTYVTWRWLDDPNNPRAQVLNPTQLDNALNALERALPAPVAGEDSDHAVRRALTHGAFASPSTEKQLGEQLADAVLPRALIAELVDRTASRTAPQVRLRVTPSPRLAHVPWELLVLPDGRRLMELAHVTYDPPAVLHADRSVDPTPWVRLQKEHDVPPVLYVVDPDLPPTRQDGTANDALQQGLGEAERDLFIDRINQRHREGDLPEAEVMRAVGGVIDRISLAQQLQQRRSRLFYFGHVSSRPEEPGSAALHLTDDAAVYGYARTIGNHRPLTALDLLRGTVVTDVPGQGSRRPHDGEVPGHVIWPMPPRVAMIACESGADHRSVETFGLVMAMLDAGAELVTSTRWTLPTDHAFHATYNDPTVSPTTNLALTVDEHHHTSVNPPETLARWQHDQLTEWERTGDMRHTPLIWASLTHHVASARSTSRPAPPRAADHP